MSPHLVEVVEAHRGDGSSDPRGNRLAHVADEIGNAEELRGLLLALHRLLDVEIPVVGETGDRRLLIEGGVIT